MPRTLFLVPALALLACDPTPVNWPLDASASRDSAVAAQDLAGRSPDLGSMSNAKHVSVSPEKAGCYTLATATSTADNPCGGDVYFLVGAMVDISSASGTAATLCQPNGTFATVEAVPSDYSKCSFMPYVEGAVDLASTGLIVADRAGKHHYKWRIADNALPTIHFDQLPID